MEEAVHIKSQASFCEAVSDPERYVVKDRDGGQRTMLLEQRKKMEEKYIFEAGSNGQAVFEEEWKSKFVDLEIWYRLQKKKSTKPF